MESICAAESAALEELAEYKELLKTMWGGVPPNHRGDVTLIALTDATVARVRNKLNETKEAKETKND